MTCTNSDHFGKIDCCNVCSCSSSLFAFSWKSQTIFDLIIMALFFQNEFSRSLPFPEFLKRLLNLEFGEEFWMITIILVVEQRAQIIHRQLTMQVEKNLLSCQCQGQVHFGEPSQMSGNFLKANRVVSFDSTTRYLESKLSQHLVECVFGVDCLTCLPVPTVLTHMRQQFATYGLHTVSEICSHELKSLFQQHPVQTLVLGSPHPLSSPSLKS